MLQALRAEALARQYSVNAELQRLNDMILTLENDVEEGNAEANADVDMAGSCVQGILYEFGDELWEGGEYLGRA